MNFYKKFFLVLMYSFSYVLWQFLGSSKLILNQHTINSKQFLKNILFLI